MTANKIRQSDFQNTHRIAAVRMREIRLEHLSENEWWWEKNIIYWSKEAANRIAQMLGLPFDPIEETPEPEPKPSESVEPIKDDEPEPKAETEPEPEPIAETIPEAKPSTLQVRVLKKARNYRYVYADNKGERIAVFLGTKIRKSIVGKVVNVTVSTVDGETRYAYTP